LIDVLKKTKYIEDIESSEFQVASRTDRYVSARSSVFSIIAEKEPILMEINSFLPREIGVWAIAEVPMDANPRYDAILRWYRYISRYPLDYLKELNFDLKIIKKGCKKFEGIHNFKNFSKAYKKKQRYVREIKKSSLTIQNNYLIFDFKSRGFLRQQIRRMVAKLLELGKGEISYRDFLNLFDSKNIYSYKPAEPRGLILWDIIYPDNIDKNFNEDTKSVQRMEEYFLKKKLESGLKFQLYSILQHNNSC
jgi:tRNA pseudouridine38-40 synthase